MIGHGKYIAGAGAITKDVGLRFRSYAASAEVNLVHQLREDVGGQVVNVLSVLSALGYSTTLRGSIANDCDSAFLTEKLIERGIDISHVKMNEGTNKRVYILIFEDGERRFYYYPGCVDQDIDLRGAERWQCFIFNNVSDKHVRAADISNKNNILTVFQCDWWDTYADAAIEKANVAILSATALRQAGLLVFRNLVELIQSTKAIFLVTLGAKGAVYLNSNHGGWVAAFPVTCVDTTGAGDAFTAGFVSQILEKKSIPHALRFAAACGAMSCQTLGAFRGDLSTSLVNEFLRSREQGKISHFSLSDASHFIIQSLAL